MKPLSANDPAAIGGFRLRARLGSGGMGRVYLGFSPAGRAVAVKVVHSHIAEDQEFVERFRREVAAASKVSGVYAAAVVASGVTEDPLWLATAYVPGPSLAALVDSHGSLPQEAVWRLAAGLAEALRAVHAAGLVHRDLTPQNVLIADDGPHVIDFGISRAFEGTQLTSAGIVMGTPGYMSPEQAAGDLITPVSDVFALGCVLAYAATGRPPFGTASFSSTLFRVMHAEPDVDSVSPGLRRVIQACLKKAPAQRPGLTELANLIATTRPPSHPELGSFWAEPVASQIAAAQAGVAPEAQPPRPDARPPSVSSPTEVVSPGSAVRTLTVPSTVREAIRLMCLGFVVTVADLVLSLMVLGRYTGEATQAHQAARLQTEYAATRMADAMTIGVAAAAVGLVGWAWLAVACRRGAGWTRPAGTALIAIYSVCALIVAFATHDDPGPRFATIGVWAIGLMTAVLLWSRPAGVFFAGRYRR
jgi:hypothetical protein